MSSISKKNSDLITTLVPIVGLVAEAVLTHFKLNDVSPSQIIVLAVIAINGYFTNKGK